LKFAPMAIPAMALLQQHDARWDILIDRRRGGVQRSNLWGIPNWDIWNWGRSELGAQSGRENQPACSVLFYCECK